MSAVYQSSQAIRALIDALCVATDCVTGHQVAVQPSGHRPGGIHALTVGRTAGVSEPVPLRAKAGGPSGLMLDIVHRFVIEIDQTAESGRRQRAMTVAYEYRILDVQETELLVYHWQPGSIARGPDFPHIHVSASLTAKTSATVSQRLSLDKRHVPTGIVTLADVVRTLIAEFGIAERRRDWPARLARAEIVLRRSFVAGS